VRYSLSMSNVQALTTAVDLYFRRFWPRMHEYQISLADLARRIAQLEDALRVSHERHSKEPHPLLDEDRLRIKEPFLRQAAETPDSFKSNSTSSQASSPANHDGADAEGLSESLDSLSVTEFGRSRYNGAVALSSVSRCLPWSSPASSPILTTLFST
jgi:hypothetical protein